MKNKRITEIAGIVLAVGLIILGIGYNRGAFTKSSFISSEDIFELDDEEMHKEMMLLDDFDELEIEMTTIDIRIEKGSQNQLYYSVKPGNEPIIGISDGKLKLSKDKSFNVMFHVGESEKLVITVADGDKPLNVDAEVSTGSITVDGVNINGKLKATTGAIRVNSSKSEKLKVSVSTGSISLESMTVGKLYTSASTGKTTLRGVIADEYEQHSSTGSLSITESVVGSIDSEGTTGAVNIELKGKKTDYNYDIKTSTGSIDIGTDHANKKYEDDNDSDNDIRIQRSTGNVKITFY